MLASLVRCSLASSSSSVARQPVGKYVLFAPDCSDDGALARRLAVRGRHLEGAVGRFRQGSVAQGGALLSSDVLPSPDSPTPPAFAGSLLVLHAPSLAAAREIVQADVYWTEGVWDRQKVVVAPFLEVNFASQA